MARPPALPIKNDKRAQINERIIPFLPMNKFFFFKIKIQNEIQETEDTVIPTYILKIRGLNRCKRFTVSRRNANNEIRNIKR